MRETRQAPLDRIALGLNASPARQQAGTTEPPIPVPPGVSMHLDEVRGSGPQPPGSVLTGNTNGGTESGLQTAAANSGTLTLEAIDAWGRVTTLTIEAQAEIVEVRRVKSAGGEETLATLNRGELCGWLTYPQYARQFDDVTLLVDPSAATTKGRLAFLFRSAIWYLSAKQEYRLYRYLNTRRRLLTTQAFMRMLWSVGVQAYVTDTSDPHQLMVYLDRENPDPDIALPKIRGLPFVADIQQTVNDCPYIHLVTLSPGDPPWPHPSTTPPAPPH